MFESFIVIWMNYFSRPDITQRYTSMSRLIKTRLSLVQIFPSNKDAAVATLTLLLLFI